MEEQKSKGTIDDLTLQAMAEEDKEMVKPFLSQISLMVYKHGACFSEGVDLNCFHAELMSSSTV